MEKHPDPHSSSTEVLVFITVWTWRIDYGRRARLSGARWLFLYRRGPGRGGERNKKRRGVARSSYFYNSLYCFFCRQLVSLSSYKKPHRVRKASSSWVLLDKNRRCAVFCKVEAPLYELRNDTSASVWTLFISLLRFVSLRYRNFCCETAIWESLKRREIGGLNIVWSLSVCTTERSHIHRSGVVGCFGYAQVDLIPAKAYRLRYGRKIYLSCHSDIVATCDFFGKRRDNYDSLSLRRSTLSI